MNPNQIDNNSLFQDSKGPFDNVNTDAATSIKCTLFAGQHRIEMLNQLLQEAIKELKHVNAHLVDQPENITIENLHMETDASLCIVLKLDEHIRKRYDIKQIIANEGKYKLIGKNQEGLKQIRKK